MASNFNRANKRGNGLRPFDARCARSIFPDAHVVWKNDLALFRRKAAKLCEAFAANSARLFRNIELRGYFIPAAFIFPSGGR